MKKLLFLSIILLNFQFSFAQDSNQIMSKSFLIISSTKSYGHALKRAQLACNKLGYTLDLRSMFEDRKNGGLTTNEVCGCGENHGYFPRGRGDDGNYISIEYSDYFDGFSEGYYIVVVSSGNREEVDAVLPKVKEHYNDAYVKNAPVYLGCMH